MHIVSVFKIAERDRYLGRPFHFLTSINGRLVQPRDLATKVMFARETREPFKGQKERLERVGVTNHKKGLLVES